MQQLSSDNNVLYALLVLSFLFFLVLFYRLFLREHLNDRRAWQQLQSYLEKLLSGGKPEDFALSESCLRRLSNHPRWKAAKEQVENAYLHHNQQLKALQGTLDSSTNDLHRHQFQEDRLYVSNQVLDNGLSTIKHETMYYPSRAQQLLQQIDSHEAPMESIKELYALLTYYRHVYSLLYEQVQRQVDEVPVQRKKVDMLPLFQEEAWDDISLPNVLVMGDKDELRFLVHLLSQIGNDASGKRVKGMLTNEFLTIEIHYKGLAAPTSDVFSASSGQTPYLIVKEIIRQHDALSGLPGLRLTLKSHDDGFALLFTLKISPQTSSNSP